MSEMANYADLTDLVRDLQAAARGAEVDVDQILDHAANQIMVSAQGRAPVKTGRLKGSIRVFSTPLRKIIGPDPSVEYGAFMEYGTGVRGEFPTHEYVIRPRSAQALRFRVGNRVVFTKEVHHPGARPHPYMRPALTDWVSSLGADAAKVGVELIVGPNR